MKMPRRSCDFRGDFLRLWQRLSKRLWFALLASLGNFRGRYKNRVGNLIGGRGRTVGRRAEAGTAPLALVEEKTPEAAGRPPRGGNCGGTGRHTRHRKRGTDGHRSRHALNKTAVRYCVTAVSWTFAGKMAVDVNLYHRNKNRLESS